MAELQSFYHSSTQPRGGNIVAAQLGNSGSIFAVVTEGRILSVYSLGQSEPTFVANDFSSDVTSLIFNQDESLLVSGTFSGSVYMYNLKTKTCQWKFSAHKSYITAMALTHSGMFLATGSVDGSVNIWDLTKQEKLQGIASCNAQPIVPPSGVKNSTRLTTTAADPAVTALAFPSSGVFLFIGDISGRLLIWNTISLAFIQELDVSQGCDDSPIGGALSGSPSSSAVLGIGAGRHDSQLLSMGKQSVRHIIAHDEHKLIAVCDGEKVTYWDIGEFTEICRQGRAGGCDLSCFMDDPSVSLVFHPHGMMCIDYDAEHEAVLSSVPVSLDNLFSVAIRRKSRFPQVVMLLLEQTQVPSVSIWVINLKNVEPFKTRYEALMAKDGAGHLHKASDTSSTTSIHSKPAASAPATKASKSTKAVKVAKQDKPLPPFLSTGASPVEDLPGIHKDAADSVQQAPAIQPVYSVYDPSRIPKKPGDTDEMMAVLLGNSEIIESMEHKTIIVSVFSELWHSGRIKAAIETLIRDGDMRVICDVLKRIDLRNGIGLSDIAPVLSYFGGAIRHVLSSKDPSVTAIHNATDSMALSSTYAKTFTGAVFNTIQAQSQASSNDFAFADRYANCMAFYDSMCTIRELCEEVSLLSTNSKLKASAKSTTETLRETRFVK